MTNNNMKTTNQIRTALENHKTRSAWDKGVSAYALELLEDLENFRDYRDEDYTIDLDTLKEELLNGASDWDQYSWGGCALIYDCDIAERLCTSSELKKTRNGERRPNAREEWLDTQARALNQAYHLIRRLACK